MTTPSDNSERLSGGSKVRKHLAKNSQTATLVASSSSAIVAAESVSRAPFNTYNGTILQMQRKKMKNDTICHFSLFPSLYERRN